MVLNEEEERLKNSRGEPHFRARSPQKPFSCVQAEIAELVNGRRRSIRRGLHKTPEKFSRPLRTFRPISWRSSMKSGDDSSSRRRVTKRQKEPRENHRRRQPKNGLPAAGKEGNRFMTRSILSLILLTTLAVGGPINAEPAPAPERSSSKNANKSESQRTQAKTEAASRIQSATPLREGWNYVKGEWIHSDGYKYAKGQVVRTSAQTNKKPPKPPSQALLNSVRVRPSPTPDPNSAAANAAAKAAEIERNKRPRPAPQTGTRL